MPQWYRDLRLARLAVVGLTPVARLFRYSRREFRDDFRLGGGKGKACQYEPKDLFTEQVRVH